MEDVWSLEEIFNLSINLLRLSVVEALAESNKIELVSLGDSSLGNEGLAYFKKSVWNFVEGVPYIVGQFSILGEFYHGLLDRSVDHKTEAINVVI